MKLGDRNWETATAAGLGGSVVEEELGTSEDTTQGVPEGPGAKVGKDVSAGDKFVSITGEESTGAAFFFCSA